MKKVYYNEYDPKAAAWLRELVKGEHIADGDVDERSILDVKPEDLAGYSQCHFFAGIGGWSLALRLAGIPDDYPIWTGSCPCQPLSSAGLRKGHVDERHLWPAFFDLIAVCRPAKVFGEQVASADGREWFAGVRADLEGVGYACGGADLCSAGVGSPNIRQRLYWVADSKNNGRQGRDDRAGEFASEQSERQGSTFPVRLAHPDGGRQSIERASESRGLEGSYGSQLDGCGSSGGMENTAERGRGAGSGERETGSRFAGEIRFWDDFDLLPCTDGKARRIEPGSFPLAHGIPGRVGLLRGYGNAINPHVAALFLKAALIR